MKDKFETSEVLPFVGASEVYIKVRLVIVRYAEEGCYTTQSYLLFKVGQYFLLSLHSDTR
jgi:hypothetical protein